MNNRILVLIAIFYCTAAFSKAQQFKDSAEFVKYRPGFYEEVIMKDMGKKPDYSESSLPEYFTMDFSGRNWPTDTIQYTKVWYNHPVSQGNSGTCWCYAATSYMESEVYRLNSKKVKLSEMYTVFYEYLERAQDYAKTKGKTFFSQGSEANAIPKLWRKYGIVPYEAYPGLMEGRTLNDHDAMFKEMNDFLTSMNSSGRWDEDATAKAIRSILEKYMGVPPESFTYQGKEFTPQSFLKDFLGLEMNNYFSFMSTLSQNYYEMSELVEDDNWWHANNYYNLPVEEYYQLVKSTIEGGQSVCICGDVSEPGYDSYSEVAVIPDFDIPSEYISDFSRQARLSNKTTTDDHCIQIVGYRTIDDETWFLIKDSGSGGFNGPNKGFRFYHEDYIRLKMMNILIHKESATHILDKIIK